MNIYINGSSLELNSPTLLADALGVLNMNTEKGIAIAINNNVVPKAEWAAYLLQSEDKVTIIKATQGG
jgi:sulfur carrier protein